MLSVSVHVIVRFVVYRPHSVDGTVRGIQSPLRSSLRSISFLFHSFIHCPFPFSFNLYIDWIFPIRFGITGSSRWRVGEMNEVDYLYIHFVDRLFFEFIWFGAAMVVAFAF